MGLLRAWVEAAGVEPAQARPRRLPLPAAPTEALNAAYPTRHFAGRVTVLIQPRGSLVYIVTVTHA